MSLPGGIAHGAARLALAFSSMRPARAKCCTPAPATCLSLPEVTQPTEHPWVTDPAQAMTWLKRCRQELDQRSAFQAGARPQATAVWWPCDPCCARCRQEQHRLSAYEAEGFKGSKREAIKPLAELARAAEQVQPGLRAVLGCAHMHAVHAAYCISCPRAACEQSSRPTCRLCTCSSSA